MALAARDDGEAVMTSEPVHDDNVAWREDREENLLDISAEACAIDRSVDDARQLCPAVFSAYFVNGQPLLAAVG